MKSANFELRFLVNRRANGVLSGFTIEAKEQAEAKSFCKTFPLAMNLQNGGLGICENGLRFINNICIWPADFCLLLSEKDKNDFHRFYEGGGLYKIKPLEEKIGFAIIHC